MSKIMTWCAGLALVGALVGCGQPAAVRAAVSWGKAIEVPGLEALDSGRPALITSVSCGSAGNCAAGGFYRDRLGHVQGFVAAERNGRWGRAVGVPGLAALNTAGVAYVNSVSCGSAGNCAAGGSYKDLRGHDHGFVAAERNGRWGRAVEVPGLAALNTGGAEVTRVSCASAGNCAAGGDYNDRLGTQGFVAAERNGRWGTAISVPGLAALNKGGNAEVSSVSCGAAGNCAAGGYYDDGDGNYHGFVAAGQNGRWGTAIDVPGLGALNAGETAGVWSVSCGPAGRCAAGGEDAGGFGFVVGGRNGRWGRAVEVPGLAALNKGANTYVTVSCGPAGTCAAGGSYKDLRGHDHGFVALEQNGRWGTAIEVPGLAALTKNGNAEVNSVSCGPAGNCAAGGDYSGPSRHHQGFVASESNGVWGKAIPVPGLEALNTGGNAEVYSLSCASAGSCAAGGYYTDRSRHHQGFVTQAR